MIKPRLLNLLLVLFVSILLVSEKSALAVPTNWNGVGNWTNDAGNWSAGVPGAGDDADIDSGTATLDGTSAAALASTLDVDAAILNISGSTLTVGGNVRVGQPAVGTVNQSGGAISIGGDFDLNPSGGAGNGSSYSFTGGTFGFTGGSSNFAIGRTGTFDHDVAGHTLTVPGNFHIGDIGAGDAEFNLLQGSVDVKGDVILGTNQNNTGTLNLSAGTSLTLTGGSSNFDMKGTSTFSLPAGQTLTVPNDVEVGSASGNAIFNLNGGTLSIANDLYMSFSDSTFLDEFNYTAGTLTFTGGVSSDLRIGRTGTFNHDIAATTTVPGNLRIGDIGAGTATFNLLQGTVTVAGNVELGTNQNNSGTLNLSPGAALTFSGVSSDFDMKGTSSFALGAGQSLTVPNDVKVGSATGNAVFDLNGGTLSVGNDLYMSFADNTFLDEFNFTGGTLTFTGGASSDLRIGRTGTFNHDNAVVTTVPGNLNIGDVAAGTATFNLLQGTVDVAGNVNIGSNQNNNGILNISSGAALTFSGAGSNFDMKGTSSVELGIGVSLTVPNNVLVGSAGGNSVFDLNGGSLDVGNDLTIANADLNLDEFNLSAGTLTFSGGSTSDLRIGRTGVFNHDIAGTTVVPGLLHVGSVGAGSATLNINSGTIEVGGNVLMGVNNHVLATTVLAPGAAITLTGASSEFALSNASVFTNPAGHTLTVPGDLHVGRNSGNGSSIFTQIGDVVVGDDLIIANNGAGNQYNLNAGTITFTGGATSDLTIGRGGELNINAGSITVPGDMRIGNINVVDPSVVNQAAGTVEIAGDLTMATGGVLSTGDYNLTGGTLTIDGTLDLTGSGTESFVLNGGTLGATAIDDGEGAFDFQSGTLNPGGPLAVGQTTFTTQVSGELTVPLSGIVQIDLGAAGTAGTDYDHLLVNGDIDISNGELDVVLLDFFPLESDTFEILRADTITGMFTNALTQFEFENGGTFDVIYGTDGGFDTVLLTNYMAPVPEPSTLSLLGLGLLGLMRTRRKKRMARK